MKAAYKWIAPNVDWTENITIYMFWSFGCQRSRLNWICFHSVSGGGWMSDVVSGKVIADTLLPCGALPHSDSRSGRIGQDIGGQLSLPLPFYFEPWVFCSTFPYNMTVWQTAWQALSETVMRNLEGQKRLHKLWAESVMQICHVHCAKWVTKCTLSRWNCIPAKNK